MSTFTINRVVLLQVPDATLSINVALKLHCFYKMRVGLYEMQILDQNGVALPEHWIGGRCYVEAVPGQEFQVKSSIHRNNNGSFPVKSSVAILSVDGECLAHWHFNLPDKECSNSWSQTCAGFYDGLFRQ